VRRLRRFEASPRFFLHYFRAVNVAELICHSCGTVSYSRLPAHRTDTMPLCKCGGRRQVVRVRADRRRETWPVIDERRRAAD
jgi:hypothetical protein